MILGEIFTYGMLLYTRIFEKWDTGPFFMNLLKIILGFLVMVVTNIHVYLISIMVLVLMDVITGLVASLKRGEKFSSRKIRRGLIERFILYGALIIIMLTVDSMIRDAVDYGSYYITGFCCTIIGFYEAGSGIENLICIFPKYRFLKKIANTLNLLEKTYTDSTINKLVKELNNEQRTIK